MRWSASTPTWWCAAGPTLSTPTAGRHGSNCPRILVAWPRSVSTGSVRRWPTLPSRSCFRWSTRPRGSSTRSPTRGIADSTDPENCLRVGSVGVGFRGTTGSNRTLGIWTKQQEFHSWQQRPAKADFEFFFFLQNLFLSPLASKLGSPSLLQRYHNPVSLPGRPRVRRYRAQNP